MQVLNDGSNTECVGAHAGAEEVQQCEMMPYLTELMGRFKIAAAGDNFDGGLCSKTFSNCILVSELKAC